MTSRQVRTVCAVIATAAFVLSGSTLLLPAQVSPDVGQKELFEKRCGGCHSLDRDKEGPRLRGVYGRAAGAVDSFQYSAALKEAKITWDDRSLDQWLADPEKLAPGNDMAFHVENSVERGAIIAYLRKNSEK